MKFKFVLILLIALSFLFAVNLLAEDYPLIRVMGDATVAVESDYHTISVEGDATVTVDPDFATLQFAIATLDTVLEDSKKYNDMLLADIENILGVLNIPEKNLSVSNFSISARYDYKLFDDQFLGYRVSRDIELKLSDLSKFNDLLELLIKNNINEINNVNYEYTKKAELFQQARENALIKARDKAKTMAEVYGLNIGKPLIINENSSRELTFRGRSLNTFGNVAAVDVYKGGGTLGKYTVSANVEVVFELLEK